jgi:hypothetical protein
MFEGGSMMKLACLMTLFLGLSSSSHGVPQIKAVNQPELPIQIMSAEIVPPPAETARQVRTPVYGIRITVKNTESLPALAYTLRIARVDENGAKLPGLRVAKFFAYTKDMALPPGGTKSLNNIVTGSTDSIQVNVDFVALADGTYFGKDTTNSAIEFQQMLQAQRWILDHILNRLERQGLAATKTLVREELNAKSIRFTRH